MSDASFRQFVLDQLGALPDLHAKAMFGGHGLYQGNRFFGILFKGRLFFRTDVGSQADYVRRGMAPFTYEQRGRLMTMRYHEVPPEILESPGTLVEWARRAAQGPAAPASARRNRRQPKHPPRRKREVRRG